MRGAETLDVFDGEQKADDNKDPLASLRIRQKGEKVAQKED